MATLCAPSISDPHQAEAYLEYPERSTRAPACVQRASERCSFCVASCMTARCMVRCTFHIARCVLHVRYARLVLDIFVGADPAPSERQTTAAWPLQRERTLSEMCSWLGRIRHGPPLHVRMATLHVPRGRRKDSGGSRPAARLGDWGRKAAQWRPSPAATTLLEHCW